MLTRRGVVKAAGALAACEALPKFALAQAAKQRTLTITTTGIIANPNPVAHSSAHLYNIFGQTYGVCARRNYVTGQLEPLLAESWERVDDTRWRIKLKQSLKRHDGGPAPTSKDVLHSIDRIRNDPASQQAHRLPQIKAVEAAGDYAFDVVTKTPYALFPNDLLPRIAIMSADLFETHGPNVHKAAPFGWGPYMMETFAPDSQVVVRRNPHWPSKGPNRPEIGIFRQVLEPEQRVTAILNNEVQIARLIPPQMIDRVRNKPGIDLVESGGFEYMFIGMNLAFKPWDDARVRRAVALAINKQLIVDRILFGLADIMDSAIGPYQDCHKAAKNNPKYDPAGAKKLLAEAGYPNGLDVEMYTASGRYPSDRQIAEVIAQMLGEVGFRVSLKAPEYSTFTQMVETGKNPFFYTGRATTELATYNLPTFYETGTSKRIGYSNPKTDALFVKARSEFDAEKRCQVIQELSEILIDETASVFMWTHKLLQAKRSNIGWTADANGEVWLEDVTIG